MVGFLLPILATGGAYLFGKSSGGGGIDLFRGVEIGTSKKQYSTTTSTQTTYSPTITRTYDIQYNIASGGSEVTTKKEQAITQQPTTSPAMTIIPTQLQGAGEVGGAGATGGGGGGFDYMTIAIIGVGAWFLFGRKKK